MEDKGLGIRFDQLGYLHAPPKVHKGNFKDDARQQPESEESHLHCNEGLAVSHPLLELAVVLI